jgi:hypothetical protein
LGEEELDIAAEVVQVQLIAIVIACRAWTIGRYRVGRSRVMTYWKTRTFIPRELANSISAFKLRNDRILIPLPISRSPIPHQVQTHLSLEPKFIA